MKAICISCGKSKVHPADECSHCGLDPNVTDEVLVKSVYLSTERFSVDDPERARYAQELETIAQRLQSGQLIDYDEKELARLRDELEILKSIPVTAVWGTLLLNFLPIILLVVVLSLLILFLGSLL